MTPLTPQQLDDLERLQAEARVTPDRPLELYCAHGEVEFLQRHTVFGGHTDEDGANCRITTGPDFDEHAMAEYVVAAANAFPALLAAARREARLDFDAMRVAREWPTPNHMRRAADALDILTPARYGDVLRWFADRCDEWVWHLGDPAAKQRMEVIRRLLAEDDQPTPEAIDEQ